MALLGTAFSTAAASPTEEATPELPSDTTATRLEDVVVTATSARQRLGARTMGMERLELTQMAKTPALFGENDIIKSISLLPGVQSEGEGSGGFGVRGGRASQNLIQMDGITLYNPSHVMGIFSTFNDDALSAVTLYKGPVPPAYGGATSSTLQTSHISGSRNAWHASGTIGLLAAKAYVAGPIVKDKLTFAVAARRSYLDMFIHIVPEYRSTIMNFYDVSAKVSFTPNHAHRLDATFFYSHDNLAIKNTMGMYWGNLGASLNWLAHAGEASFLTTAAFTDYAPDMRMSIGGIDQVMTEYTRDWALNEKVNIPFSDAHRLELGLRSQILKVNSGDMKVNDLRMYETRSGWENAAWADYEGDFSEHFSVTAGARLSLFSALSGKGWTSFFAPDEASPEYCRKTYVNAEPRVSLKWNINETNNIKAGFGMATQNLHTLRSTTTTFPFDRTMLSSATIRPEKSLQAGLGYSGMTEEGDFDWQAEVYYKKMNNVYDYLDGVNMFSAVNPETLVGRGEGRSYGAELMFRKNNGPVTGWISYTISKTQTRIPEINGGEWYDASNDRRHDFSITAIWTINKAWTLSGTWIATSGTPLTAPDVKYVMDDITYYYYSGRNRYRTPPTHRLDISATWTRQYRHFKGELSFGFYNAYCQYNPYVIYFEADPTKPSGTRAVQMSLFGIVPSISYTISL